MTRLKAEAIIKLCARAGVMNRRSGFMAGALIVPGDSGGLLRQPCQARFLSDDLDAIVENPTIRSLWPINRVLTPPHSGGETVGGRPLVNFTLALNYALGDTDPRGYHAFNLLIHALAALTLFGCVRRTLDKRPGWSGTGRPTDCAFAATRRSGRFIRCKPKR